MVASLQNRLSPSAEISVLSLYHGETPNEERPDYWLGELPVENENKESMSYSREVDAKVLAAKVVRSGGDSWDGAYLTFEGTFEEKEKMTDEEEAEIARRLAEAHKAQRSTIMEWRTLSAAIICGEMSIHLALQVCNPARFSFCLAIGV